MCMVSNIGDLYTDRWNREWPQVTTYTTYTPTPEVTKEEFEALKKEVLEMKELLKKAIKYDEDNGEPDCHMDEKVAKLKAIAELVGVDLADVLK